MRKRVWVKVIAAVGLACALGLGWALGSPRVPDVQESQPPVEIPLYEGAQVEWEVRLATQEMPKQLSEWVQTLSVLEVAGYEIEGERVPEVLSFYEQALQEWRRILWHQPSEWIGVRLFAKQRSYLLIVVSKKYQATDLFLVTAQADAGVLDAPLFEGAELQWEALLTRQDFMEYLKRWLQGFQETTGTACRAWGEIFDLLRQPSEKARMGTMIGTGLGIGLGVASHVVWDLSELKAVGYRLEGNKALDVLSFYEQQFKDWRRNLWIKPEESGSIRVFTRSDAQGLQELVAFIIMSSSGITVSDTSVIVLWARR